MYLVIGANGYLGAYFIKNILETTDEKIIAADMVTGDCHERVEWYKCDITNFTEVDRLSDYVKEYDDIRVVFLAAYHHPDKVEQNPQIAWHVNVTALSYFLNRFNKAIRFTYPSTDSVYGEGSLERLFKENDKLAPVNLYGKQKAVAECLVMAYGGNVVRYPFLIGKSLLPERKHFYDEIVETILSGRQMGMFVDSYRSAISFNDAARLTLELTALPKEKIPPVVNVSGDKAYSKYEVGILISEKYNVSDKLIIPIKTEDKAENFTVKRAKCGLLDNSLLKETLGLQNIPLIL